MATISSRRPVNNGEVVTPNTHHYYSFTDLIVHEKNIKEKFLKDHPVYIVTIVVLGVLTLLVITYFWYRVPIVKKKKQ